MKIEVLNPGSLTTVQDLGRVGWQNSGVGETGAMDREALRMGNALVGNQWDAAGLEMTMAGGSFRFDAPTYVALTGADMQAVVSGIPVPRYRPFIMHPGQTLQLGAAVSGCRGYLCVRGGIDVPLVMGSRSTDLKCRIGGMEGRKLRRGDVLPVGTMMRPVNPPAHQYAAPQYPSRVEVRAVPGPQDSAFTESGLRTLFCEVYRVTPQSDRMGLRLEGPAIESRSGTDIVSDGIVFGSVQVPASGCPIILMADHQTTGGYAKAATVISEDLPKLAQLRPGDELCFRPVTIREARKFSRLKRLRQHLQMLRMPD